MNEKDIFYKNTIEYFNKYGYTENNIFFDQTVPNSNKNNIADAILITNNEVIAVIEMKSSAIINHTEGDMLITSPFIMQLQTFSNKFECPFYILTNGIDFVWFKTDDNGRPKLIDPVRNVSTNISISNFFTLEESIRSCQTVLKKDGSSINSTYELLLIILSHIGSKKNLELINQIFNFNIHFELNKLQQTTLTECKKILNMCDWSFGNNLDFLFTLDLILSRNSYARTYKIPLWLADFMIKLSGLTKNAIIYDPHANYGEIYTALTLSGISVKAKFFFNTIEGGLYTALVNLLLKHDIGDIEFLPQGDFYMGNNSSPDFIITALPFGRRNSKKKPTDEPLFNLSELSDQILLSSLDSLKQDGILTALVPESFLFSGGQRKQLREYILNTYSILNIISLPVGTLSPYSGVKSSVIVIQKKKSHGASHEIQMNIIRESFLNSKIIDCRKIPEVNSILDFSHESIKGIENTIFVPAKEVRDTINVETYFDVLNAPSIDYPLVPLKNICKNIVKGKNIKLNNEGDVPVIGPGAIRPFNIDPLQFNNTRSIDIEYKSIKAKTGDILLNSISTFLGSAAMVRDNAEGYISQHVILIDPDTKKINPEYLEIAINSKFVRTNIQAAISGSVIPSLNVTRIRELLIPIPSLDIQQKLIQHVKSIREEIQSLKNQLSVAEESLNQIVDALGVGEENV